MEPKIPTLKDSKKPQVKVRGLEAGVTLFDRLKQFKKKDLAFILAGLGTLFMAPLAEHFMMAPEGGDSALNAGFGGGKNGGGHGLFDNGSGSVGYDVSNGQAPGSAVGGGSDVITPLNVRDPSALVMGPGATQQPPTQSVAPATPPPTAPVTRSDSDLKDALAASARGIGSAAHAAKALLPVPKIGLTGAGGLRGLGVANGGSSASSSLGPISSSGLVGNKAAVGGGLGGVKNSAGVKGVARGQSSGASGGLEALKAAAGNAGNEMNRGSATTALDNAAAQAIPAGGSNFNGSGQGGAGANDKAESGNGGKDNKSSGESLEFQKQKQMQEKKIELWAKEQEAGDNKLEMLKLRNSMAEAIAGKIGGAVGDAVTCPMTKGFKKCWTAGADPGYVLCSGPALQKFDGDGFGNCGDDGVSMQLLGGSVYNCKPNGSGDKAPMIRDTTPLGTGCESHLGSGKESTGSADDSQGRGSVGGASGTPGTIANDLLINNVGTVCQQIDSTKKPPVVPGGVKVEPPSTTVITYLDVLKKAARQIVVARDAAYRGSTSDCSADTGVESLKANTSGATVASDEIKSAVTALAGASGPAGKAGSDSAIGQAKAVVTKDDKPLDAVPGVDGYKAALANWTAANDLMTQAKAQLTASDATMKSGAMPPTNGNEILAKKLKDLTTSIGSIRAGVEGKLKPVDTATANLKTELDDFGRAIGQLPMDGSKGAPLQNVVANNVEYKKQMGDPDASALKAIIDKVDAHNKALAAGGNYSQPEYNLPEGKDMPKVDPKTATAATTTKAIDDTQTSLTALKTNIAALNTAIPTKKGVIDGSDEQFKKVSDAADSAAKNKSAMQQNQSSWLDNIQSLLPDPAALPAKTE